MLFRISFPEINEPCIHIYIYVHMCVYCPQLFTSQQSLHGNCPCSALRFTARLADTTGLFLHHKPQRTTAQHIHFCGGFPKERNGKELLVSTTPQAGYVLITYLPHWKDFLYVIQVDAVSILIFSFSKPGGRRKQTKPCETSLEPKLIFY